MSFNNKTTTTTVTTPPTHVSQNEIVELNIGGHKFSTTKSTLLSSGSSFFSGLISGRIPSLQDNNGAFFIDRDGQYFPPILEFLRNGSCTIPSTMDKQTVLREASFYCVEMEADMYAVGAIPQVDGGMYYSINPSGKDVYFYFKSGNNEVICQSFRSTTYAITHQTKTSSFIYVQDYGLSYNLVFMNGKLYSNSEPCLYKKGELGTYIIDYVYTDKDGRAIIFADDKTLYIYEKKEFGSWCCCTFEKKKRKSGSYIFIGKTSE